MATEARVVVGRLDTTDWAALSTAQQIQHIEVEGFCVFPNQLSASEVGELSRATQLLPTTGRDYSDRQRGCALLRLGAATEGTGKNAAAAAGVGAPGSMSSARVYGDISPHLLGAEGSALANLLVHTPTLSFLRQLVGPEVMCFSYQYDRAEVGTPGLALHAGAKPFGASVSGTHVPEVSSPVYLRSLFYLDDLTVDVSPFRIVPRSHISLHSDANPYLRYESHPEQVIVTLKAGSMILFHERCFHGTLPNVGTRHRAVLAVGWRPAWAGPTRPVPMWNPADMARLPPAVQHIMGDPNQRKGVIYAHKSRPSGMASKAPGIDPSRWSPTIVARL